MESNDFRYEHKYIIPKSLEDQTLALIKSNVYKINEQYQQRRVNSIYYDSDDLILAKQNVDGNEERHKIRLRYYGDISMLNNPTLEIKSKKGYVGTKKIISIDHNNPMYAISNISEMDAISNLPLSINYLSSQLKPVLLVSYVRRYFVSSSDSFRLTLDTKIIYKSIDSLIDIYSKDEIGFISNYDSVLEIKYDVINNLNYLIGNLKLPFRLTRNSKYITGLSAIGRLQLS